MARPVILIASALLAGSLAVVLVARTMGLGGARPSGPRVVVAAAAVEAGMPLQAAQLRIHAWPAAAPEGAFDATAPLVGRVLRQPLVAGEPVLDARLAPVDGRGGLSATLAEGKRAITVRVNDVIGVAGFALPGTFVDVIVSARDARNEPFARIVLERIRVLAVAQETVADPTKPKVVTAVTLEVTPAESERLDLARSVGNLSLSLRNELDRAQPQASGMRLDDLMRQSAAPAQGAAPARPRAPPPAAPPAVEEWRGTQLGASP